MKGNSKLKKGGLVALSSMLLFGSAFAYFTDNASKNVAENAGTVKLGEVTLTADSNELLVPGDERAYTLAVENLSDVDTKMQYTFVVEYKDNDLVEGSPLAFNVAGEVGEIVEGKQVIKVDAETAGSDVLELAFDIEADNSYQAGVINITAIVEVLQDGNTDLASWVTAGTSSLIVGGLTVDVVPSN